VDREVKLFSQGKKQSCHNGIYMIKSGKGTRQTGISDITSPIDIESLNPDALGVCCWEQEETQRKKGKTKKRGKRERKRKGENRLGSERKKKKGRAGAGVTKERVKMKSGTSYKKRN